MTSRRRVFLASVAWDLWCGEPASAFHPVTWMGRWLGTVRAAGRNRDAASAFSIGAAGLLTGMLMSRASGRAVRATASRLPAGVATALAAAAFKSTFAVQALFSAVYRVESALYRKDIVRARQLLARDLVSRPTVTLDAHDIAAAAIESLAENLSDSIVAPWLAYRVGGLPAAAVYRFVNTADAMLGYRTPELEWFGKPAARLDDLLNLAPARLTALLIACSASAGGGCPSRAWYVARRDCRRTTSPNAGWPMAAMAGALDRQLSKPGIYRLNPNKPMPAASDIRRARRIAATAVVAAGALLS